MTGPADPGTLRLWVAGSKLVPTGELATRLSVLSPGEIARYEAFVSPDDRHRFLLAHWMLRNALGETLGLDPVKIELSSEAGEKPSVLNFPSGDGSPQFNLSHSEDAVAVAVAAGYPVGIDVEPVSRGSEALEISRRRFTESENEILRSLTPGHREEMALWMWTAKEAVLKALGKGLAAPLETAELAGATPEALRVVGRPREGPPETSWALLPFRVAGGTGVPLGVGSICVPGDAPVKTLALFRLRPGTLEFETERVPVPEHRVLEIRL